MSEGAPYRHNNEKYFAFAFPLHTHIFAIWLDDCRVLQHFVYVSIALPSFALLGARAGWQLTPSLPARARALCVVRVYTYIYYIDFAEVLSEWSQLAFDCRTLWTRTFLFFESSGCACVPVRVCLCARGEKCDVNTSENETRKEEKNEKQRHHLPFPFTRRFYYCYLLWFASLKDMLKVEKEKDLNRCVFARIPRPRPLTPPQTKSHTVGNEVWPPPHHRGASKLNSISVY